jgi:hypothetical protein
MKTYKTIRKLFDKENLFWKDNIELNLRYVRVMEICLVDFVKINGWGSLNDAYDFLGFPRTIEGQKLGWTDDTMKEDLFNVYYTDGDPDLIIEFRDLTELF